MLTVFSIGLNVGAAEPDRQLSETLRSIAPLSSRVIDIAMGASEWQGIAERFLHVAAEMRDAQAARLFASHLARTLRQDAVAFLLPDAQRWILVDSGAMMGEGGTLAEFPCIVRRALDLASRID